jgi:hypothetical protein
MKLVWPGRGFGMQRLISFYNLKRICLLGLLIGAFTVLAGCQEANLAIDFIVGRDSTPSFAEAPDWSPTIILAARRTPGEMPAPNVTAPIAKPTVAEPAEKPVGRELVQQGKKRSPGQFPPGVRPDQPAEEKKAREVFTAERDPFRPPTEILPTECPPSMPLCRFDHSQLKLVGVMQVADGQFKAMVEDPDGRGYFVVPGTQIGGATVTQVSTRGITLYVHKSKKDVPLPLYKEARESSEM